MWPDPWEKLWDGIDSLGVFQSLFLRIPSIALDLFHRFVIRHGEEDLFI